MQPGYLLRNRYRIEKPLSSGGFGQTYLAVDEDPDYPFPRKVVVKHLKPQSSNQEELDIARRLFESEAKALAELGQTTDLIPALYAFFEEGCEFYLVQEFIEGPTLTEELGNRKLSEAETLEILRDILVALKVVHDRKRIHRDLKPDNIIRHAKTNKLVLIDFGAVKAVRQGTNPQISQSIRIGTPGYTPQEQNAGHPRFASDIYAVGAIGLQCLTGIYPYNLLDEHTAEFNWRHLCQVSEHIANVLAKMVAREYRDRYVSVTEAQKALTDLASRKQHQTTPINILPPTQVYQVPARSVIVQPSQSDRDKLIKLIGFVAIGAIGYLLIANGLIILVIGAIGCLLLAKRLGVFDRKLPLPPLSTFEFTSVKLNRTGDIIEEVPGYGQLYEENLGNGITVSMVKICEGSFLMGSPGNNKRDSDDDERPEHHVRVEEFYMGQTQITQSQYQAIMGENPSGFKGNDRPVESISWHQAQEFCQKLSAQTGRSYTLPSESQWEYACRAGTNTRFYFGDKISTRVANYNGDSTDGNASQGFFCRESTIEVAQFPPNAFGLYDMYGNVWEWCQDHWHENYQSAPTRGEPWLESRYSKDASRVLRGGSWDSYSRHSRSAVRWRLNPSERSNYVGFRLVTPAKSLS